MFSSLRTWVLTLGLLCPAHGFGEACINDGVSEHPEHDETPGLKPHSLLQALSRSRRGVLAETLDIGDDRNATLPNISAVNSSVSVMYRLPTAGNASSEGKESDVSHAVRSGLDGQLHRALAQEARGNASVHFNASENASLRDEMELRASANASQRAIMEGTIGTNSTGGAIAPAHSKPKEKPRKSWKNNEAEELTEMDKTEADYRKGKSSKHEEAPAVGEAEDMFEKAPLMDKGEKDYRKGRKTDDKGMMKKYGIHPVQAIGFFVLTLVFSFWGRKIYKENHHNTW